MTDIAELKKQAIEGDPDAMWSVADAYLYGRGVEIDIAKGDYWCEKWIQTMEELANNGDKVAMRKLSVAYEDGEVVYQNLEKSRKWTKRLQEQGGTDIADLEKRAKAGDKGAMWTLAEAYLLGCSLADIEGWDWEIDTAKGKYWCEKWIQATEELANNGDKDAMWSLAMAYECGAVVGQDLEKSREWKNKIAGASG